MDNGFADFGEFPWMIAVIKKSNMTSTEWSNKDYVCAGTLIHPSVILTSTRAISKYETNEIKCRAGEWDKTSENEEYMHQERNVRKIVNHQHYFRDSVLNSVSLIFLEEPFNLIIAPHVGAACVGQTLPEPGTQCFGTGWGKSANTKETNVLKKIPVNLLSSADCQEKLRKTQLGKFFKLHNSLTCGSSPDDSCKGDHAAPLVCPVKDVSTRYVVYGMSAYRINESGAPCAYVKVPAFYNWIGEKMAEEGFYSNSYTYVS
ncbi:PREDICTED: tryptase beta-2-like isoform X2 [Papilio polytes]|nr:PREDICTED: tryptase beta-2-like isoform X2 [Papilio polytes]